MTRRHHSRWGSRRQRRARRSRIDHQTPPGGLLLLAVAGFIVYNTAQPTPADNSLSETGDRVGAWAIDSVIDVLEVIAGSGGNPT